MRRFGGMVAGMVFAGAFALLATGVLLDTQTVTIIVPGNTVGGEED